jgi:hypothetical protein
MPKSFSLAGRRNSPNSMKNEGNIYVRQVAVGDKLSPDKLKNGDLSRGQVVAGQVCRGQVVAGQVVAGQVVAGQVAIEPTH